MDLEAKYSIDIDDCSTWSFFVTLLTDWLSQQGNNVYNEAERKSSMWSNYLYLTNIVVAADAAKWGAEEWVCQKPT